ncbi:MAG: peptide-methionine (S)-S-oxide reductase MsrA [Capnocytophaga sp.]|nr:peptide-methionine (S)-S-oxide reductase MsrA [Capnocytophaga sp.]
MKNYSANNKYKEATFAAGCFWCVEAVFDQLKGVVSVKSGYAGGHTVNPSYKDVCTGETGHAEVLRIIYDPAIISYEQLLTVLWHTHNPTTLNRQGVDHGTQYRSSIFYHNDYQRKLANKSKKESQQTDLWKGVYVTEIVPLSNFYPAEEYHDNYFALYPDKIYCSENIAPKMKKFRKQFADWLK